MPQCEIVHFVKEMEALKEGHTQEQGKAQTKLVREA